MIWQGKAFGALLGISVGGPAGALIGALLGHLLDEKAEARLQNTGSARLDAAGVQEAFFRATFQVMGHVAKADGRVSEEDIRAARAMMNELRLGEREVKFAIELYTAGKAAAFPLAATLQQLARAFDERPELRRMFVQIQLQAALWGSGGGAALDPLTRKAITQVCEALDVSAYELVQMEALLRMQKTAPHSGTQGAASRLQQAYEVLGVPASAADGDVTKAYRRLMSQNHPDKLHAKGLPESMMKVAEEKTRQILAAYEAIRAARGMR
jgi:DnaJ like chaperone protein